MVLFYSPDTLLPHFFERKRKDTWHIVSLKIYSKNFAASFQCLGQNSPISDYKCTSLEIYTYQHTNQKLFANNQTIYLACLFNTLYNFITHSNNGHKFCLLSLKMKEWLLSRFYYLHEKRFNIYKTINLSFSEPTWQTPTITSHRRGNTFSDNEKEL